MKYILIAFAIIFASLNISAQKSIDALIKKYDDKKEVQIFTLNQDFLQFIASGMDKHKSKFGKLKVLIFNKSQRLTPSEKSVILKDLDTSGFEQLMAMRKGDSDIVCYVIDDEDYIKNVVMLIEQEDQEIVLALDGKIHYQSLKDIELNVQGAEFLKNIDKGKP